MFVKRASLTAYAVAFGLLYRSCLSGPSACAGKNQPSRRQKPAAAPAPAPAATPAPAVAPAAAPATVVRVKLGAIASKLDQNSGEDQNSKKKICYTTRDFVSDQNQPVMAVAVYDVQGDPQKIVRFLMPLGFILCPREFVLRSILVRRSRANLLRASPMGASQSGHQG